MKEEKDMSYLPQIILILLMVLGAGIVMAKNGQPRTPYSFWSNLISDIITFAILYWGGFFDGLIAAMMK